MNAQRKPSIAIPETNLSASKMMRTFITRRKRPSVMMVKGKVKIMSSGLTIAFRIASTSEKMSAVVNDLIAT